MKGAKVLLEVRVIANIPTTSRCNIQKAHSSDDIFEQTIKMYWQSVEAMALIEGFAY